MRKRVVRDALGIVAAMIFLVFLTEVFADGPIPIFVSPTGTDSPTCGTEASPCKTITYAFQNFYSKGYLNVMAGTYNESLDLYHDVIIKGAGAATTIIAGSNCHVSRRMSRPGAVVHSQPCMHKYNSR